MSLNLPHCEPLHAPSPEDKSENVRLNCLKLTLDRCATNKDTEEVLQIAGAFSDFVLQNKRSSPVA